MLPECTFVIFGATGDLTKRKLIPALFRLHTRSLLPPGTRIIAVARHEHSDASIRKELAVDAKGWDSFAKRITYHKLDFEEDAAYESLRAKAGDDAIFYFATPPSAFPIITKKLHQHKMSDGRLIFEKPFGSDAASAKRLNESIAKHFKESQIYRIDHYLGKEFVQNIMVLRFTNAIFNHLWSREHIDNIQIIVAEQEGIGTRASYYDHAGALRDMVQNHLLQLVALTTMEQPKTLSPDDLLRQKARVLSKLAPQAAVVGQYTAGRSNGKSIPSYRAEHGVAKNSTTETYAAVKLALDLPQWRGVPIYLSTGKALKHKYAQVVITFKQVPCTLFCGIDGKLAANTLVIRIQPDEGVALQFNLKEVNAEANAEPHTMEFSHAAEFGMNTPEAYERLLSDAMLGDQTLFTSWQEVKESWRITDKLMRMKGPLYPYKAGTHGPAAATAFLARDGRQWYGDKPVRTLNAR